MTTKEILQSANVANVSFTLNALDLKEVLKQVIAEYTQEQTERMKEMEKQESYLTPQETASILKCSIPTLCRWHKSNYLVPLKVGRMVRYRQSDIDRILKSRICETSNHCKSYERL